VPALAARIGRAPDPRRLRLAHALSALSVLALFVASLLQVAARTYNPFIYFRF
jgi:hypothetical protein